MSNDEKESCQVMQKRLIRLPVDKTYFKEVLIDTCLNIFTFTKSVDSIKLILKFKS